ncbi:MAG: hypothetical protein IIB87_07430, partial [Chloroflexi bacterium]|nr:hypothetical protein [Chloroflexota bacterium]
MGYVRQIRIHVSQTAKQVWRTQAALIHETWGRAERRSILLVMFVVAAIFVGLTLLLSTGASRTGLAAHGGQHARPASDITTGGWGVTPLWDKLDEITADDATTEIQSSNDPLNDLFEVALSSVTDPLSSIDHTISYRVKMTGTKTATVDASLYQGLTLVAADAQRTLTTAYQTFSFTLSASEADAITDYSDLRIRLSANSSGAGDLTN